MPEVGLFDIGMPGLDGYQLAAALRREPGGAGCLLVAITGWGQEGDRQRAREAGFDEHLVKPVDMDQLSAVLARAAVA
jgi:CheY-like chemotaxis protein